MFVRGRFCGGGGGPPVSPGPPKTIDGPGGGAAPGCVLRGGGVRGGPGAGARGGRRGEGGGGGGGELTAASKPWSEVAAAKEIDGDILIFPTRYMGELCVRGWLRPVRKSVLESDKTLDMADIFPLVRRQLITWGGQAMALPLGINLPGVNPTRSAVDYVNFLVRAAPNVVSPEWTSPLFDPETMNPRITDAAFVVALKDFEEQPSDGRDCQSRAVAWGRRSTGRGDSIIARRGKRVQVVELVGWRRRQLAAHSDGRMGRHAGQALSDLFFQMVWNQIRCTRTRRSGSGVRGRTLSDDPTNTWGRRILGCAR